MIVDDVDRYNVVTSILIRGRPEGIWLPEEWGAVGMEEVSRMWGRARSQPVQAHFQSSERQESGISLQSPEETGSVNTLTLAQKHWLLDFWPPDCERDKCVFF